MTVVVGWTSVITPHEVPCVTCRRRVKRGVANPNNADPSRPGFVLMCHRCLRMIVVDARDPVTGAAEPEGWAK